MSAGRELYIYWRVAAADLSAALTAAHAMQGGLRAAHPGLEARLLQRCDAPSSPTVMEIYRHPQGVTDAVAAALVSAALPLERWCAGGRHVEAFVPVEPA